MDEEELMKKVRELEESQAELRREVSKLHDQRLQTERRGGAQCSQQPADDSSMRRHPAGLSRRHHATVMESLGQAVHVLDLHGMMGRNRNAEHLYGYPSAEAVGEDITRLIVHPDDIPALNSIVGNVFRGKCWRGNFPVKNKSGERFFVLADATPLRGGDGGGGSLMGLVCLSEDTRTLLKELIDPSSSTAA